MQGCRQVLVQSVSRNRAYTFGAYKQIGGNDRHRRKRSRCFCTKRFDSFRFIQVVCRRQQLLKEQHNSFCPHSGHCPRHRARKIAERRICEIQRVQRTEKTVCHQVGNVEFRCAPSFPICTNYPIFCAYLDNVHKLFDN